MRYSKVYNLKIILPYIKKIIIVTTYLMIFFMTIVSDRAFLPNVRKYKMFLNAILQSIKQSFGTTNTLNITTVKEIKT